MGKLSRRRFIETTGTGLVASATLPAALDGATQSFSSPSIADASIPRTLVRLRVNGGEHEVEVEDRWTLADLLRDRLNLTGTKIGCNRSECGACTVLLDGMPIYSCTYLAVWAANRSVATVEGLAKGGVLDPLQQAFIEHDAPQCGFCTSGQLMAAKALLQANPRPSAGEVRSALTGNLCRCSNYNQYVAAVLAASASITRAGDSARSEGEAP